MAVCSLQINGKPRVKNLFMYRPMLSSHQVPMKITMSQQNQPCDGNNNSYCESIRAEIEAHLKQAIPLKPPLSVFGPMHHLTFSAPPNYGPALCVSACELVGGSRSHATAAAATLHLVEAAAFTHENLPLSTRPKLGPDSISRLKAHHAYRPNIELLLPDAMVPFGLELLATSDDPAQDMSYRVLRVMVEITRVIGSQGIIGALYQEIVVDGLDDDSVEKTCNSIKWVDDTCHKRKGMLHACAAACGAILGGANEEEVERLRNYGHYVGILQWYSNSSGIGIKFKGKEWEERVVELKNLALKELQHFKDRNVEAISSFISGP